METRLASIIFIMASLFLFLLSLEAKTTDPYKVTKIVLSYSPIDASWHLLFIDVFDFDVRLDFRLIVCNLRILHGFCYGVSKFCGGVTEWLIFVAFF